MKTSQYTQKNARPSSARCARAMAGRIRGSTTQREALEAKLRAQREVIAKLRAKLEQFGVAPGEIDQLAAA